MLKPMTGKCTMNCCQYQEDVWCVCMLNDWIRSNDEICADNGKVAVSSGRFICTATRPSRWTVIMRKVCPGECLHLALVVSTSVLHPTWQRITPSPSECEDAYPEIGENPFVWYRLRVVRCPGVVFGTISRRLDGSDWVEVRSAIMRA